jgi:predicted nucleotidyltransferase
MFGLPDKTISLINDIFAKYPKIEKVLIYGSRARGDHKSGSDIDLSIIGDISYHDEMHISFLIDDLPIPYMCDLSILKNIKNENLVEHIERVGQVFYEKTGIAHAEQKTS